MSFQVNPVAMRDIEQSESTSVFVVNMSNTNYPTQLVIKYSAQGGDYESVVIPPTWIPIDLAETAPKKFLMDSVSLRKAYNEKKLIFVSTEQAMEILEHPKAQKEMERIQRMRRAIDKATQNTTITESNQPVILDPIIQNAMTGDNGADSQVASQDVGADHTMTIVMTILANLLEDKDEEAALNTLRTQRNFSSASLRWLATETPDEFRVVHEWLSNNMESAKRRDENTAMQSSIHIG